MKRFLFLAVWLFIISSAFAANKTQLLTRLSLRFADPSDDRLTQASKTTILDAVATDISREYIYTKLDTLITVANQERYALNSDCAGAVSMAYVKQGAERTWLRVVDGNQLAELEKPQNRALLYAFLIGEQLLGLHSIPKVAGDTVIVEYYAYIPALAGADTIWAVPDAYEEAALDIAAGKCYQTLETPWAMQKGEQMIAMGRRRIQEIKNASTVTVQAGDTSR